MGLPVSQQRDKIRNNRKPVSDMNEKIPREEDIKIQNEKAIVLAQSRQKGLIKNATGAEKRIRRELRRRNIPHQFQAIIIKSKTFFIADFLIDKLIIEIDGNYHSNSKQKKKDARRTHVLTKWGYKVIRFTNRQAIKEPQETVSKILAQINPGEYLGKCLHSFSFVDEDLIECSKCKEQYSIDERSEQEFL